MPDSTLFFAEALLPDGWAQNVRIDLADGVIAAITPSATPAGERFAVGLPGLPNLHSHAFQRGMAGLAETRGPQADSFWTWRQVMYRFLGALSPDDVEAIAALAYAEMLESGFTRVGEFHYLHHAADGAHYADPAEMACRIAAAAAQTGIGLTLLPVFYAHGNFGAAPPAPGQRRFLSDLDGFALLLDGSAAAIATLPDAVLGVAPHSLRAVTPTQLSACIALAGTRPLHIHVAEQRREVEDCLAWSGARPVQWLLDHADPGPTWCAIHATHMQPAEAARLARTGAVAGLCPLTEANLGDGTFDGVTWQEAGGRLGVGTDSNIQIGAAAELRQLEYSQRLATLGRNVLAPDAGASTGHSLFAAALAGGMAALGCAPGGLRPGASADLVALDADHPSFVGRTGDGWLDGWIFATDRAVDSVWRQGRRVVSNGRHVDRTAILRRYRSVLLRVMSA